MENNIDSSDKDREEVNHICVDLLLYLSIVLFLASLIFPLSDCLIVLGCHPENEIFYGFHALFFGWVYLFSIKNIFLFCGWLSNLLLFSAWSRLNSGAYRESGMFGIFGLLLSSGSILNMYVIENEMFYGVYVWVSSFACVLFTAVLAKVLKRNK